MTGWLQTCLLLTAVLFTLGYSTAALQLPYEVLDSIVELSSLDPDFTELAQVNVSDDLGPTRPIYRLDLDPDFIAYYEIDMGSDYILLSSGRKTGDFRKVESGPDPRPTDVLIQQAQENGQRCEKFYRLSPMGLTICKNDNGTVVGASYNWTAGISEVSHKSCLNLKDPDFIAYYEIDMGSDYILLSSGRKTGDFRKVESGPDPRPTDVLIQQAQENGQRCEKFYRLSPMGLTICKNDNGTVVGASYNWTAGISEIGDWRLLDQMVNQDLDGFKRQWRAWGAQKLSKSDWATTDVFSKGKEKNKKQTIAEVLSSGSIVELALGERYKSVHIYVTDSDNTPMPFKSRSRWQQKLCKVLLDVCLPDGSTNVVSSAIKEKPNHLSSLKLQVHANRTFVGNVLRWREIVFVVEINGRNNEVIKKHFAIDLHPQRTRRSTRKTLFEVSIPSEQEIPDYDQFICCPTSSQDCRSGSGAVAWAQVFGYYDRLAGSPSFNSTFSATLYGDSSKKAPLSMTDGVKSFVETIRPWLQTSCAGITSSSDMHGIAPWFRTRQGLKSRVESYLERRKKRSNGASVSQGSKSWIESSSAPWLNNGFPVVFEIETANGSKHFAVATKYKQKSRQVRRCSSTTTGWWWGWGWWWPWWRRSRETCWMETERHKEFFLHYGWGGHNNKWQRVSPYSAHVAHVLN